MMKRVELIIEPFGQNLDIFLGDDFEKLEKYVTETFEVSKYNFNREELAEATFNFLDTKFGVYRYIVMKGFSATNPDDVGVFVHELYHAIVHVLKQVEVKTKDPFDELTAYLLDCNVTKFLKAVKEKKFEVLK